MGGIIVLIGFIFLGVAFTLLSRVLFAGSATFVKIKTRRVNATVLGKRKKDMFRSSGIYTNFFITFDLGHGDRLELPVSKKYWRQDNIGKSGVLTYKGEIFISFDLNKTTEKHKKETYILNGEVIEK